MNNEHNEKLLSILSDIDSKRKCEGKYFKNRSVIMPSRKEISSRQYIANHRLIAT